MLKMLIGILLLPLYVKADSGHNPHLGAVIFESRIDLVNFTHSQEEKFKRAVELIKKVLSSEEFRKKVYTHVYEGRKQFVQSGNLSNAYVYLKVVEGEEELFPSVNFQMDMEVELWKPRFPTSTIGYTSRDVKRIWIKKSFYENSSVHELAGNIFHEWLHKIGFEHDLKPTARRPYSVPYAVGDIMSEMGRQYLKSGQKFEVRCFEKNPMNSAF